MTLRRLAARVYASLKAKTRKTVDSLGKQANAAEVTRVEQQHISDYCSINRPGSFMPVDVLADLLDAGADPALLAELADLAGCLLVPLPRGKGHAAITERSGRTAEEFGQVMAGILAALGDGRITRAEAAAILTNIHELMLELAGLAEAVKAATVPEDRE